MNKKIFQNLSRFATILAGKKIVVTSVEALPKKIKNIIPTGMAVNDGETIYLSKTENVIDEEALEIQMKQQCLEQITAIKEGYFSRSEGERPDFSEYSDKEAALSLFNLFESRKHAQKARLEYPAFFKETSEKYNRVFIENFAKLSRSLSGKKGKQLRKLAVRYEQLSQRGDIDMSTSAQFTRQVYGLIKNELNQEDSISEEFAKESSGLSNFFSPIRNGMNLQTMLIEYSSKRTDYQARVKKIVTNVFSKNGGSGPAGKKVEELTDKLFADAQGEQIERMDFSEIEEIVLDHIDEITSEKKEQTPIKTSLNSVQVKLNAGTEAYQKFLSEYGVQIIKLKRLFEKLKGETYRKIKRQESGSEIDVDASIDCTISMRNGEQPEGRFYQDVKRDTRDVLAGFLLDVSESTNGYELNMIKGCTGMLAEALEHIGDRYMIYAFGGDEFYVVKSPQDKGDARKKVWELESRGGTPQGHATKDIIAVFNTMNAKTKILFSITDGRPDNVDGTRKALLEAKAAGIHPYSITVDTGAEGYADKLFGNTPYCFCTDVSKLPEKAAKFYEAVAF